MTTNKQLRVCGDPEVLRVMIDPAVRSRAKQAAKEAGMEFSKWVERVLQQHMLRASVDRLNLK
jgi:antitoxin component of RelBE/YafQ-DinJ toxin-antitoxin module